MGSNPTSPVEFLKIKEILNCFIPKLYSKIQIDSQVFFVIGYFMIDIELVFKFKTIKLDKKSKLRDIIKKRKIFFIS